MKNVTGVIIGVFFGALVASFVGSNKPTMAQFGSDGGRWQMAIPSNGSGAWRIDTETGYLDACSLRAGEVFCIKGNQPNRD